MGRINCGFIARLCCGIGGWTVMMMMVPLLLCACADSQREGGASGAERPAPQFQRAVRTQAAVAKLDPAGLVLKAPGEARFIPLENGQSRTMYLMVEGTPAKGQTWKVIRGAGSGGTVDPKTRTEQEYQLGSDGSVEMLRSVEHGDSAVTVFQPQLRVLPAGLGPGQTAGQKVRMVVRPIGKPEKIKAQGDATNDVTLVSQDVLRIAGREVAATHVRAVLKANLGPAKVEVTTDSWYAPGLGLVQEESVEHVTVLGVITRNNREQWVLDQSGPGSAGALRSAPASGKN